MHSLISLNIRVKHLINLSSYFYFILNFSDIGFPYSFLILEQREKSRKTNADFFFNSEFIRRKTDLMLRDGTSA